MHSASRPEERPQRRQKQVRLTRRLEPATLGQIVIQRYRAYGIELQAESRIPGLEPAGREDSVTAPIELTIGYCPEWARQALQMSAVPLYAGQTKTDEVPTFQVEQVGNGEFFRLFYSNGTQVLADAKTQRIWGTCPPPLTLEDLCTYLLGPVMGFVLRRRGILALHASCFCIDGRAFALCGSAGCGKSTAAAALAVRGAAILCEDIAAVRERDGTFYVAPGYPRVNLWPDSAAYVLGDGHNLPKITPNWEKLYLGLGGKNTKFETQERALEGIYIMESRTQAGNAPRIREASPQEAVVRLIQNTYMNYLLSTEQRADEFDTIMKLAAAVPVRLLTPSYEVAKINAMCELLEDDARAAIVRDR